MQNIYEGKRLARVCRGAASALAGLAFPLGNILLAGTRRLCDKRRLERGLVIVLPGIEGGSSLNWSIAEGLHEGGVLSAIVVHDWTTRFWPLFLFHLRSQQRNRRQAETIACTITNYQDTFPNRPVYLVGHSGGAALAVWTLETLPTERRIAGAFLLAPALSPGYDLTAALQHAQRGIWNFYSPFDVFFLAFGTVVFGTCDGRHSRAAGQCGFQMPKHLSDVGRMLYQEKLHQQRYRAAMARQFHHGGHFGWANRVFVAETLGPLCRGTSF